MLGMMQIMIWLLALYLVFKGVEILQIGIASSAGTGSRSLALAIGVLAVAISVAAGAYFVQIGDQQAESVARGMEK